jgi:hypothetical protein
MPKRRLKLPRPAVITAVGGSDRVVWMTTQGDPTRIDVLPLVNRGQPKQHELPEPIAHVASHPRSDLVVCVGADSGRLYVVDLDGRSGLRVIGPSGIARVEAAGLVLGRVVGVLAAQAKRALALTVLDAQARDGRDGREADTAPIAVPPSHAAAIAAENDEADAAAKGSTLYGEHDGGDAPTVGGGQLAEAMSSVKLAGPLAGTTPSPSPHPSAKPSLFRQPTSAAAPASAPAKPAAPSIPVQSLNERFSAWRDRMRAAQPRSGEVNALGWVDPRPSWRDELVAWARGVAAGTMERNTPPAPALEAMLARFAVAPELYPALALLYGMHLAGVEGAAPVDIARVLGRRWDEALGHGQLAQARLAFIQGSRVMLGLAAQRALDERPPEHGTLVGVPGTISLLGPCVVVAPPGPLAALAETYLASVGGAILAAHGQDALLVLLEARAYGAAAMIRAREDELSRVPSDAPIVLVVEDEASADALGVPRIG